VLDAGKQRRVRGHQDPGDENLGVGLIEPGGESLHLGGRGLQGGVGLDDGSRSLCRLEARGVDGRGGRPVVRGPGGQSRRGRHPREPALRAH
jgi:hypothetical protein